MSLITTAHFDSHVVSFVIFYFVNHTLLGREKTAEVVVLIIILPGLSDYLTIDTLSFLTMDKPLDYMFTDTIRLPYH